MSVCAQKLRLKVILRCKFYLLPKSHKHNVFMDTSSYYLIPNATTAMEVASTYAQSNEKFLTDLPLDV